MALNIKNAEVEALVTEVARLTGESKTDAVRVSLVERRDRLRQAETLDERKARIHRFLETELWPSIPPEMRGTTMTKEEEEEILGFGPDGW